MRKKAYTPWEILQHVGKKQKRHTKMCQAKSITKRRKSQNNKKKSNNDNYDIHTVKNSDSEIKEKKVILTKLLKVNKKKNNIEKDMHTLRNPKASSVKHKRH